MHKKYALCHNINITMMAITFLRNENSSSVEPELLFGGYPTINRKITSAMLIVFTISA